MLTWGGSRIGNGKRNEGKSKLEVTKCELLKKWKALQRLVYEESPHVYPIALFRSVSRSIITGIHRWKNYSKKLGQIYAAYNITYLTSSLKFFDLNRLFLIVLSLHLDLGMPNPSPLVKLSKHWNRLSIATSFTHPKSSQCTA